MTLIQGDCFKEVPKLEDNSLDLVLTDFPYGISFMGKDWDSVEESFFFKVGKALLPKMKPGSFLVTTFTPRMDMLWRCLSELEKAGFEMKTSPLFWLYHTGFPKAMDVNKKTGREQDKGWKSFQLKPSVEIIIAVQKPRTEKTIVGQVLKNGCGAVNIEGCRIPYPNENEKEKCGFHGRNVDSEIYGKYGCSPATPNINTGRFPANLLVSGEPLNGEGRGNAWRPNREKHEPKAPVFKGFSGDEKTIGIPSITYPDSGSVNRFYSLDAWWDKRNITLTDESAFFDVPKPSKSEKNKGCEDFEEKAKCDIDKMGGVKCTMKTGSGNKRNVAYKNNHPTTKPVKLFTYLAELFSRKDAVVLDPFMGSGTTGIACSVLGRRFIGIELEEDYYKIAEARIKEANKQQTISFSSKEGKGDVNGS